MTHEAATAQAAYRVFTTRFDVETPWENLGQVLGGGRAMTMAQDRAWAVLDHDLLAWRTRQLILASEAATRLRGLMDKAEREDSVVTLLLDQSGSMRGQKMLYSAATLDIVQELLAGLGIRVEVLGFTTVRWKGGRSRLLWRLLGSRKHPGRLNDLLHVVYRDADDTRVSTGGAGFRVMLRPDLPKENIDGEALLWAAARLRRRPERRKALVVLSDGAPVDDSTLMANTAEILSDHLRAVIASVSAAGDVRLSAVGIGFAVDQYYADSAFTDDPTALCTTLIGRLERLLAT